MIFLNQIHSRFINLSLKNCIKDYLQLFTFSSVFILGLNYIFYFDNRVPNDKRIRLIAVAVHPHENAIATTDALGQAHVYRGNFFQHNGVGNETLHWHFLPTTAVCFSLQGNSLSTI